MTSETHSRPLRPDDLPAVATLLRESGGRMTPERYRWKFLARPTSVDPVIIGVDERDQAVFHVAGIACRCRLAGTERSIMIATDGMTAPGFRRRGLLTRYLTELFDRWRTAGIAFVLGLPNENWGTRIGALGWRPLGALQWLVLPLRPERLVAGILHMPWLGRVEPVGPLWRALAVPRQVDDGVEVTEVTTADERFDAIWLDASPSLSSSLFRDRAWVAWRYLSEPAGSYRVLLATRGGLPVGYAAYSATGERRVTIAEVFTAAGDSAAFAALAHAAVARAIASGADYVRALALVGTWPHREFRRAGFFRSRHAFGAYYVPLDPSLNKSGIGDASDWVMLGGDYDVV